MKDSMNNTVGIPAVVDRSTFDTELDALRIREKAHTKQGDVIAAARRRLPMVEVDGTTPLIGARGAVTPLDAFEGPDAHGVLLHVAHWLAGLAIGPAEDSMLHGGADTSGQLIAAGAYDIAALAVATGLSVFKPGRSLGSQAGTQAAPTTTNTQ